MFSVQHWSLSWLLNLQHHVLFTMLLLKKLANTICTWWWKWQKCIQEWCTHILIQDLIQCFITTQKVLKVQHLWTNQQNNDGLNYWFELHDSNRGAFLFYCILKTRNYSIPYVYINDIKGTANNLEDSQNSWNTSNLMDYLDTFEQQIPHFFRIQ